MTDTAAFNQGAARRIGWIGDVRGVNSQREASKERKDILRRVLEERAVIRYSVPASCTQGRPGQQWGVKSTSLPLEIEPKERAQ